MSESAPAPRIPNVPRAEWTDAAREVFAFWGEPGAWENGSRTNLVMTLANHPPLGIAFNTLGKHLLLESPLPVRARELVVLRTSWHLKSEYEWHYHVGYALAAGLTLAEIAGIGEGPEAAVWADKDGDAAVLSCVDELMKTAQVTDATWAMLSRDFDKAQLMDLIFTIGQYVMISWAIAAFRMPMEPDVDLIGFDLRHASGRIPGERQRPGEDGSWTEP